MRFAYTDEMHKLMEIYEPYMEDGILSECAPKEAIEAREKLLILFKKEKEKASDLSLM